MDVEVIDIMDNSQHESICEEEDNEIEVQECKPIETKKHKICPLFLPRDKKQKKEIVKETNPKVIKEKNEKETNKETNKKKISNVEIIDCIHEQTNQTQPVKSQKRPKEKDLLNTPDMFLTKAERADKKRRLMENEKKVEVKPVEEKKDKEENKKATKVCPIFQKSSVRKQLLVEQADTSFKKPIHWKSTLFPKTHFILPKTSSFHCKLVLPDNVCTQIQSIDVSNLPPYFSGNLPQIHETIEEIIDYEDDKDDNDFLPVKLYIALPAVQAILNYFIKTHEELRQQALKYLQFLYPRACKNKSRLWIDVCNDGGIEGIWNYSSSMESFYSWLSSFSEVNFNDVDDEEEWYSQEEENLNNCYLIAGYEGKTSLLYHLSNQLGYKVIEVNNVDQEIANIVTSLQEATQSRVMKGNLFPIRKKQQQSPKKEKEKKAFTKCPVILIDDIDINIPAPAPFLPSPEGSSITSLSTLDIYSMNAEKSSQFKQGFLKSVKQLIHGSKCPVILTATKPTSEIINLSSHSLTLSKPDPFLTSLHIALITLANTTSLPSSIIHDACLQYEYDCRKIITNLQFLSAYSSNQSFSSYSSMLHWPYSLNSSKQISIQNNIHSFLDDPNLDYFFTSNFLPFFCKNHPARNYHSYHDKTIEITSFSPSLVSLQGGSVVITGNDVSIIHEILLIGCEEGSMNISFERQNKTKLLLHIPSLPRGLYSFQFITSEGIQILQSSYQPWFGLANIYITDIQNTEQQNSEDEFEEHSSGKWKRGKTSMLLLSDLFSGKENELFESEEKKSEEKKSEMVKEKKTETESDSETDSETETETEIEITESSDDDIEIVEEKDHSSMNETIDELLFLADCYDYLICETQLQQKHSSIIQTMNDENYCEGRFYHPLFYWREKEMAFDLTTLLYQSSLQLSPSFLSCHSLSSCEKQILMDYWRNSTEEKIYDLIAATPSLSYILLQNRWKDYFSSIFTIQLITRCDYDAKEFSRRGQQIFKNIEKLLNTADRTLCSHFVEVFRDCTDFASLCSDCERDKFWPSI